MRPWYILFLAAFIKYIFYIHRINNTETRRSFISSANWMKTHSFPGLEYIDWTFLSRLFLTRHIYESTNLYIAVKTAISPQLSICSQARAYIIPLLPKNSTQKTRGISSQITHAFQKKKRKYLQHIITEKIKTLYIYIISVYIAQKITQLRVYIYISRAYTPPDSEDI